MDNNILQLIQICDESLLVTEVTTLFDEKEIHIERKLLPMYCPCCKNRMYSKGIYTKRINHSVLQGLGKLTLVIKVRRWHCKNCNHYEQDAFNFVEPYKHTTNLLPYLIINEFKNINITTRQIAKKFSVSDTYIHNTFMRYVSTPRLPLTSVLCIDEVYMNFNKNNKYACVLYDFVHNEVIDILPNRYKETLCDYFSSISMKERDTVKYFVSDMYKTYQDIKDLYFPNAISIIDSFHVIFWINHQIELYIAKVKKKYRKINDELLMDKNYKNNFNHKNIKQSKELYILNNFKWALLQSESNIVFQDRSKCSFLNMYLDTYQRINLFMSLDDNFPLIKEERDKYISFNNTYVGDPDGALKALDELIEQYLNSKLKMFNDFALLLKRHKKEICSSFNVIKIEDNETHETIIKRISNSYIESFNNYPKDLKRVSNGISNPEFFRKRVLFATRTNVSVLGVPLKDNQIHEKGKKRGSYKKSV